ncbi:GAD-like domain-containing protein, partial [Methylobacterium sp. A49B]
MEEIDAFARVISDYGPPENARRVPPDVIESYKDYFPPSMISFWERYGWGEYKSGYCRICDPRPF